MECIERVYGALLGLYVGDGFGSQTDGMDEQELELVTLDQVYSLEEIRPLCGMSGEISDLGSLMAISMLATERLDTDHLKAQILRYGEEDDNHLSVTVKRSLETPAGDLPLCQLLPLSLFLSIASLELSDRQLPSLCNRFTSLFNVDSITEQAVVLLVQAFSLILNSDAKEWEQLSRLLLQKARRNRLDPGLSQAILTNRPPKRVQGVLGTLSLVFSLLNENIDYTQGIITLAKRGGEARLACSLFGALKASMEGKHVIDQLWVDEIFPSPALESMFKYQTLYKRETITMEKLANIFSKRLLDISIS